MLCAGIFAPARTAPRHYGRNAGSKVYFSKFFIRRTGIRRRRAAFRSAPVPVNGRAVFRSSRQKENTMESIRLDQARDADFLRQVEEESGQKISACYQCGNCTAGCPGGQIYDLQVSQIMRAAQLGLKNEALRNRALWLCLSCHTCSARCPNNIDVAGVMETLRGIARREKIMTGRPIEAFWKAFLDTVRLTGRSFELGVMADYMLRTGRGWGNMDMAPAALARRKLPFLPRFIGGRAEVARIFKRYGEKGDKP